MIRNIVGALVYVGAGKAPAAWIARAPGRPRPHARGADVRGRRALPHRCRLRRAWGLPPTRRPFVCRWPERRSCARASRSAASLASRTASPRRVPARRDRPRVLAGNAARRRRGACARDRRRAAAVRLGRRSVRRSGAGPRARDARRGAARPPPVPRPRGARPLPRVRPSLPQGRIRCPRSRGRRFARIRGAIRRRGGPSVRCAAGRRDAGRHGPDVRLEHAAERSAATRRAVRRAHRGNVADAIRRVRPWAVDVSSGVEAAGGDGRPEKGIKDPARIAAFIEEVRNADG